jgi:hypothetical protein
MADTKDKVTNEHPEYTDAMIYRKIFADVCSGTAELRKGRTNYLPEFPKEHSDSYKLRNETASFLNVTAKTRETFCGLVFQKDITLNEDVPQEIQNLWENIDNKGTHGNVFSRDLFEDSFDGCAGFLVDSPSATASDLAAQRSLGLRPYWVDYDAKDIINWDYEINPISKKMELSLVVLRECVTQKAGQFLRNEVTQYRVLMLDEVRNPVWQLWTEKPRKEGDTSAKEYELLDGNTGKFEKQTRIPFAVIGQLKDRPQLMDLAYKNIEHYQTYSDYKSVLHKCCRPLFFSINLDGDPAALGSDLWFKCNEGGSIGFAEPAGTSIDKVEQCLENIKHEMATLGLAMIAANRRQNADVTATEKMLDSIQETSALQVQAVQLKDAIELALGFTAQYLGLGEDKGGSIELGATWAELIIDPQELTALSGLVDLGQLSLESFLWYLEKGGKLPPDISAEDEVGRIKTDLTDETLNPPTPPPILNPNSPPGQIKQVTDGQQNPPLKKAA